MSVLCKHCGGELQARFNGRWYHYHNSRMSCTHVPSGRYAEPMPFWQWWVGHSNGGPVVMWGRRLFKLRHLAFDLHMMVGADKEGCFHTHPAKAIRLVLWGGYREELWHQSESGARIWPNGRFKSWRPGMVGWVHPETCHRIHELFGQRSISLWIRWPVTHKIKLMGDGWNG